MSLLKKTLASIILFSFIIFTPKAYAEDALRHTLRGALYGGVIGGLIGSSVLLLTDNPDDHLTFIPTGIGVGVLLGTAYGIASSGAWRGQAFGEVEDGKLKLNIPTIKTAKVFHEKANKFDIVESVDLLRVRF